MLPAGRSVAVQIFGCDEGVMGSITTEEQTEICRRPAVGCYSFYNTYIFSFRLKYLWKKLINSKLPLLCISWALFALLLSRVRQVRSFVK